MATVEAVPAWVPTDQQGAQLVPAGRDWDAVAVDSRIAGAALARLRAYSLAQTGSVLIPGRGGRRAAVWLWLVPRQDARGWRLPAGVRVLDPGEEVYVPPASLTSAPGPHWHPDTPAGRLTTGRHLAMALNATASQGVPGAR